MKKITIFFLTLILPFVGKSLDRFVDPNLSIGNGTTLFTTITSAVATAVNGDRILIYPGVYNEPALTINKSLTMMAQTAATTIFYNANITIDGFAGMKLEILGFDLGIYSINATGGGTAISRAKVSIINSKMQDLSFDQDYFELNCARCIMNGITTFRFGNFVVSKTNDLFIKDEPNFNLSGNKILIAADTITNRLEIRNDDYPVLIANNLINKLYFYKWNSVLSNINFIKNNEFVTNSYLFFAVNPSAYNFEFSSNLFNGVPNFFSLAPGGCNCPPAGQYNTADCLFYCGCNLCISFSTTSSLFPTPQIQGFFRWTYNGIDLPCTIPNAGDPLVLTKIIGPVGTNIDAGNPNHDYYDIDLTINDRGVNGGPYSLLNYNPINNPSNGKAFIFDLEIPADLFTGQQVNIKAKGYHKY